MLPASIDVSTKLAWESGCPCTRRLLDLGHDGIGTLRHGTFHCLERSIRPVRGYYTTRRSKAYGRKGYESPRPIDGLLFGLRAAPAVWLAHSAHRSRGCTSLQRGGARPQIPREQWLELRRRGDSARMASTRNRNAPPGGATPCGKSSSAHNQRRASRYIETRTTPEGAALWPCRHRLWTRWRGRDSLALTRLGPDRPPPQNCALPVQKCTDQP